MQRPTPDGLVQTSLAATGVFALSTAAAVAVDGAVRTAAAWLALALFSLGCGAFVVAFLAGVARSRTEEVSVAGLFLLMGSVPQEPRRRLWLATFLQTVIAVVGASLRPFTALAFGILVPVLGLGIGGLWSAWYGSFAARETLDHKRPAHARTRSSDGVPPDPAPDRAAPGSPETAEGASHDA